MDTGFAVWQTLYFIIKKNWRGHMEDINKRINKVIQDIDEITAMFYQQKNNDAYIRLERLISEIAQMIDLLYTLPMDQEIRENNTKLLTETLQETLQAMSAGDTVLVADILKYEVSERLTNIAEELH